MKSYARILFTFLAAVAILVPAVGASALPPGGTFNDDDGSVHEGYIEAIAAVGITKGCNPPVNDRFCPDRSVTRGEMAAFLVRALGLSWDGGKDWFDDDDGSPFEPSINRLAAAGITRGCNAAGRQYCPNDLVTREQMAAFLVRAYDLAGPTSNDVFTDDNGSPFEDDIEKLQASGVTKGCNPPRNDRFCPASPVSRGEMATFIGRAGGMHAKTPPPRIEVGDVDVHIYPGDDIDYIANDNPDGTVFMIHGVHYGQQISPRDYQVFLGDDGAVLDGEHWAGMAFHSYATGVQIIGLEIRNYEPGDWRGAISGLGGSWLVESCDIHDNRTAGIWLEEGDPVVRNNYIHHNDRSGLSVRYTQGGLIENNEIAYNNYRDHFDWGNEGGGGKMWSNDGLVLRGNWSHHNHGPGLWTDHDNINILYEDNLLEDNYANGIFHEISYDAVIRNNVFRRNGFDHAAWMWGGGIMIASSQNVEIYGNILEDNYNGIAMTRQNRGWGSHGEWTLANNYVHNNTVINSGLSGAATDVGNDDIYYSNIRFESNSYSGDSGWFWMNGEVSWWEWQSYGHDS
jgi:parallel beta-helix repeat protein